MRHRIPMLLIMLLAAPTLRAQVPTDGQWLIERPGDHERAGLVHLTLRYGEHRFSENWTSDDVPLTQLVGLPAGAFSDSGGVVRFRVVRDAGTLVCEGWFSGGNGAGHFTYAPNPEFVTALARRGIDAPTPTQQFRLTLAGVGLDLADELARQGYDRPTIDDLTRMATHGVGLEYVRALDGAGYRLKSPVQLVRMRDHGVDAEFIASLDSLEYRRLSAEQLVRVRDHGVDGDYIREMRAAGYPTPAHRSGRRAMTGCRSPSYGAPGTTA